MCAFLPEGYQKPASNSKYLKFVEGDNKFRILSNAITGYLDWSDDKKPLRTKEYPRQLVNQSKPAKHFWAFVVWDYKGKEIKILEITQATVQTAIYDLHNDPNWGDPKGFDINVRATGKDMERKYSIIPTPPMAVHPEIKKLYEAVSVDLNALYSGADPFATSTPENVPTGQIEPNMEIAIEDIPF